MGEFSELDMCFFYFVIQGDSLVHTGKHPDNKYHLENFNSFYEILYKNRRNTGDSMVEILCAALR